MAHLNGDEATPRGGSLSKDVKAFRKALADEQIVHKELLVWLALYLFIFCFCFIFVGVYII